MDGKNSILNNSIKSRNSFTRYHKNLETFLFFLISRKQEKFLDIFIYINALIECLNDDDKGGNWRENIRKKMEIS